MALTIVDALTDEHLFGGLPQLKDISTWTAWIVFLKAQEGLPLSDAELKIFQKQTGLDSYDPPPGGWNRILCLVGRQSGKTLVRLLHSIFECVSAPTGSRGQSVLLVSQDQRNSTRVMLAYANEILDACPLLRDEVIKSTTDSILFRSGVSLMAYPCRAESVRGIRARLVNLDEICFFRTAEGRAVDREMVTAVTPTLATTGGKLVMVSSPYAQTGVAWDVHQRYFGKPNPHTLVWQASAPTMNPTLSSDYLERMRAEDPEAYRSEVAGEFRSGLSLFLDSDTLSAVTPVGVKELPHTKAPVIRASVDVSTGTKGGDDFAVAVAIGDGTRQQLAAVRSWSPPFKLDHVVEECAAFLKTWGVDRCVGDKFAGAFVIEKFADHGIVYQPETHAASDVFADALAGITTGTSTLLDHPKLLEQLRQLERRALPSGRDRIQHPRGRHDDLAVAACGALNEVASQQRRRCRLCNTPACSGFHPRVLGVASPAVDQSFEQLVASRGAMGLFPGD